MTRRVQLVVAAGLVVVGGLVLIQVLPFPRAELNPDKRVEPPWDSPRTRELAARACFDCHSNETTWPAYASIAPFSWRVHDHVREGREELNFSEWDVAYEEAEEAGEVVEDGEMPLRDYLWMHPEARLTDEERDELARGLEKTVGAERW